eukprot:scaffold512574_cov20-Prasinocladus_malaysianus.AAC.1
MVEAEAFYPTGCGSILGGVAWRQTDCIIVGPPRQVYNVFTLAHQDPWLNLYDIGDGSAAYDIRPL